mmetsp:Transcript_19146/g.42334  ORF Transcript_19146/g.42334 Transcript_19146/m.42334 type:complete len:213 (+) Transcript_19146:2068-2706(+)
MLLQHLANELHETIKMVVSDIRLVMSWSQIAVVVRAHASKDPCHVKDNTLFVCCHPGLVLLEEALGAHIRCGLLVHELHEAGDTRIPSHALVDRLRGRRLLGLADVVGLPVDQHVPPRRLHDHDSLIDGIGVGPHIPQRRLSVLKEAVELEVRDGHHRVDAVQGAASVCNWGPEDNREVLALGRLERVQLAPRKVVLNSAVDADVLVELVHE